MPRAIPHWHAALLPRCPEGPKRLIDLGAGSGANARALLPRIAGDQEWTLVDRDRDLIAAQDDAFTTWARRQGYPIQTGGSRITIDAKPSSWRIAAQPLDLARDLDRLAAIAAHGITAAAFFDLVSQAWLQHFAALLIRHRIPLLAVLTVDGKRDWRPRLDEDGIVTEAFARHQLRDKGFGPALGGTAAMMLETKLLRAAGFAVTACGQRLAARSEQRRAAGDADRRRGRRRPMPRHPERRGVSTRGKHSAVSNLRQGMR